MHTFPDLTTFLWVYTFFSLISKLIDILEIYSWFINLKPISLVPVIFIKNGTYYDRFWVGKQGRFFSGQRSI